jgi:RNA polymerase sigma-70 factor (ECF subfamily)
MKERFGRRRSARDDLAATLGSLVPGLRRLARGLQFDKAQADDLVQDCLERAIARWNQFNSVGSRRAWLYSIMINIARDQARADRRRGSHIDVDELEHGTLVSPPTQEVAFIVKDALVAIGQLSDDHRELLLLVSVEGFSYAEAAEALGLPVGTVMSRLARARDRLRRLTEGVELDEPRLRRVK